MNLYIIPALGENTKEDKYQEIANYAISIGYSVVEFNPNWTRPLMSDFISEASLFFKNESNAMESTILGFSFGAFIATVLARKVHFSNIISCSVSPFFRDDLDSIPDGVWKSWGEYAETRRKDFYNFEYPGNLKIPIYFLVGEKEEKRIIDRTIKSFEMHNADKELIKVKKADHDIAHSNYQKEIKNCLQKIKRQANNR